MAAATLPDERCVPVRSGDHAHARVYAYAHAGSDLRVIPAQVGSMHAAFAYALARHARAGGDPWTLACVRAAQLEATAFARLRRATSFSLLVQRKERQKKAHPVLAPDGDAVGSVSGPGIFRLGIVPRSENGVHPCTPPLRGLTRPGHRCAMGPEERKSGRAEERKSGRAKAKPKAKPKVKASASATASAKLVAPVSAARLGLRRPDQLVPMSSASVR